MGPEGLRERQQTQPRRTKHSDLVGSITVGGAEFKAEELVSHLRHAVSALRAPRESGWGRVAPGSPFSTPGRCFRQTPALTAT